MDDALGAARRRWYDKAGAPIDVQEALLLSGDEQYTRVGRTEIGPVVVCTSWLGLDHQYVAGPPLIFETMVFPGPESGPLAGLDEFSRRYATEVEALVGHEQVCELVRAMSA